MENKSTYLANRINQIRLELCNGNNKLFAQKLGKSTQYTSALCKGTKQAGKNMCEEILRAFPEVSRTWLILGEGDMIVENNKQNQLNTSTDIDTLSKRIMAIRHIICNDNNRQFAQKIDIDEATISKICNGTRSIGKKSITKILNAFPEINPRWLIMGEGHMLNLNLKPSNDMQENKKSQQSQENKSYTISKDVLEMLTNQSKTLSSQSETIRLQAETINKLLDKKMESDYQESTEMVTSLECSGKEV